jgi:hypothetical protein
MLAWLALCAWAQSRRPQNPASGQSSGAAQQVPAASSPAPSTTGQAPASSEQKGVPQSPAQADESEKKISPKATEELFRSVDEILKFASKDTTLPIHEPVKRRLVNRDEVVAFVQKHMAEDEDAQRLRRSELVLKKFGLLPRDFDLQSFLVVLLREQVAGYYDPQTKTVNLLDWIEPDQQKPVLAHELTHALQDQSFGLEKYMKAGTGDLAVSKNEPTPEDIQTDEASAAHQAVVEGQAMVVLLDYELAPKGMSVVDSPEIVQGVKAGMIQGTPDSVDFRKAPLYIKEALTFPYRYGLDFETELLTKLGKDKAYEGVFRKPPSTTREIMEPQAYLSGEKMEAMRLPDFKNDFKGYDKFDVGAVGEFDVAILLEQYQGEQVAKRLYPHWRGGYYYAARPHGDASAPLGLLYVSRWSSAEKASEFAWVYAKGIQQRYKRVHEVEDEGKKTSPANYTLETLTGAHAWLTEEGSVFIDVRGDTVLVSESLDQDTTEKIEGKIFGNPAAKGN